MCPPGTVRGAKSSLWEGGVHVPCIVSGPAVSGSLNRTNDETIMFVDFFKTMLEAAGLNVDDHVPDGAATDSISFAAHLTDENAASTHTFQFSTRFANPANRRDGRAIATDDFKLILYDNGNEEFFDRTDEFTNLFDGNIGPMRMRILDELLELMAIVVDPPKVNFVVRDDGSIARPDLIDSVKLEFNQKRQRGRRGSDVAKTITHRIPRTWPESPSVTTRRHLQRLGISARCRFRSRPRFTRSKLHPQASPASMTILS